jgi:hypothetical protein
MQRLQPRPHLSHHTHQQLVVESQQIGRLLFPHYIGEYSERILGHSRHWDAHYWFVHFPLLFDGLIWILDIF